MSVDVGNTSWLALNQNVSFVGPANFQITAINSSTNLTLKFLGLKNDVAVGTTIASGSILEPSLAAYTVSIDLKSATVPAITDNSTGAASSTIAAGAGVQTVSIPIQLAAMTAAAADLITNYVPGYKFKLLAASFVTTTLGTGAGASQSLSFTITGVAVTGGVLALTLAGTTPLGAKTDASAVTALNTGSASDTISLKVANGGTVFTGGAGIILLRLQNMDTADAIATLASKGNSVLGALRQ